MGPEGGTGGGQIIAKGTPEQVAKVAASHTAEYLAPLLNVKSKDKAAISTYRLILSSINEIDIVNRSGQNKKETDDEDIKKLLKKMIKQRVESIDIYKKNNRQD